MSQEWTFRDEINLDTVNLPRAALQFARDIAYPSLNVTYYLLQIEELAQEAERQMRMGDQTAVRAEMLSEFLFQRAGYHGNLTDYNTPQNSFLNEVLDTRRGIPISLSVLFLAVASRLNIPAAGVGMPGHFIVTVPDGDRPLYFDPFNGGGRLTRADCARLVEVTTGYQGTFQPAWLDPVDNRMILTRMLNNLRLIYTEQGEWGMVIKTVRCLRLLDPETAVYLRDLGVAYFQLNQMPQALACFEAFAQKAPHAADLEMIRQGIAVRMNAWVRQN